MTNKLILALVFGAVAAAPAFAQTTQATPQQPANGFDSRWTPYLGCWRIVQEHLGDQTVPVAPGLMVCARPSGSSGVAITTTVDGKNVLEQTIVANGLPEPVAQADCQGAQTSEWSRDGERLFTRVELECAGRPKRVVSGITQLAKGHWVEAQATVIDGHHDVRLRRYRRTSDQVAGGSPATAAQGSPLTIEDVIEASAKVLSPALEAALVEAGGRFTLNSRSLEQLADAGVSPNVIDLMVAQAFPDRFQVERPSTYPAAASITGGSSWGSNTSMMIGSAAYPYAMYDPFYSSYYYYSPFAYPYYWGSSYSPYRSYGYGYRNYNNYYYGGSGGTIYHPGNPGSGDGTAQPGSPNSRGGDGIVVKGRGYTRVRPSSDSGESGSSAAPTQRTAPSGRGARTVDSGSESSSSGSSSSGSSSGASSSGGASSGGYSGGGNSGGEGGRTAQPR